MDIVARKEAVRALRLAASILSAEKELTPDEYHAAHGQCPDGYHFNEENGTCEPNDGASKEPLEKKSLLKRSKEAALNFLRKAEGETKQFFNDAEYRKKAMKSMAEALKKSPKAFGKRLAHAAKEEVHEFKLAGQGMAALARGEKLDHHQKKALQTVAVHMAISVAAAAATASGLGILGGVAKAMGRSVVAKALSPALVKLHLGEEVSHIAHLFAAAEYETKDDDFLKSLEGLSEDEMMEALGTEITKGMAVALESVEPSSKDLVGIAADAAAEEG